MTTPHAALLEESTSKLCANGWASDHDEANFPRFHKALPDRIISFVYQAIVQGTQTTLAFIGQVNSPAFSTAFGVVADTKFTDIGISHNEMRLVLETPQADDVIQLAQRIEDWGQSIDPSFEIAALAASKSRKTHETLKHLAALGLLGDRVTLEDYLAQSDATSGRFGKAGPQQIKAALEVAASA